MVTGRLENLVPSPYVICLRCDKMTKWHPPPPKQSPRTFINNNNNNNNNNNIFYVTYKARTSIGLFSFAL